MDLESTFSIETAKAEWRSKLHTGEYSPEIDDRDRANVAKAWGKWIVQMVGGSLMRPVKAYNLSSPLRVGYVSADFCQHTVGLFIKDVLLNHNFERVQVFTYSAGEVEDWVTLDVMGSTLFRDVSKLDDAQLAQKIRADQIEVLVDLSGHTAGSRLTAFAYRPAPVMVSWLGYFATTGLPYMDAVLLDEWHVPEGTEAYFTEPIIRMPGGRLCYRPVPWAPAVISQPPCVNNGFITFGSFNNTAKYNSKVFQLWAKVMHAVPNSRLILKWSTFDNPAYAKQVAIEFGHLGIESCRLDLRGASYHEDMLKEYGEVDIALDPFPFTGGLTSCEALWMGLPVITWPQQRVVSRQTYAFLQLIGAPEWVANSAEEYVEIAQGLAENPERLVRLRSTQRDRMLASPLMDVKGFTRQLEDTLIDLHKNICRL